MTRSSVGWGNGAPPESRQNTRARFRGRRWHGVIPAGRQHVLPSPQRTAEWRKATLSALSKVVGGGGRKATGGVGTASAARTVGRHAGAAGISGCCGAQSIIPAQPRRGVPQGTLRSQMYRAFPEKKYGQRAKVETIFSVVKRKLSSRAPGRSLASQIRQALLLGLTYNLYRLRHPYLHEDVNRATLSIFRINTYEKRGEGWGGYG